MLVRAAAALRMRFLPHLLFIFTAVTWASSFILMKKASAAFGPMTIGTLRVAGGALALAGLCLLLRQKWRPRANQWPALALIIVIGYASPYCVQPYLIARHDSGFVGIMVGLVPLLTILVSKPMLGVLPSTREMLGVCGGFICLIALFRDGLDRSIPWPHLALAVSVPLGYAIANTAVKRSFADAPPLALTLWCLGVTTIILAPFAAAEPVLTASLPRAIAAVAALGVLGTGLCGYAFYTMIRKRGPLYAGMVSYLIPLGALAFGWFDGEQITITQMVAVIGIVLMVALVQLSPRPGK
jgi:drug/metabolite transporter (DMT)-like permease